MPYNFSMKPTALTTPHHNHILQFQEKNSKRWTMNTTLLQGLFSMMYGVYCIYALHYLVLGYPLDILIDHRFNPKLLSMPMTKLFNPGLRKHTELCTIKFKPYQKKVNVVNVYAITGWQTRSTVFVQTVCITSLM